VTNHGGLFMGKARVTVSIDEDLKERLQIDAVKKKTSMSKIIEKLVADYLLGEYGSQD